MLSDAVLVDRVVAGFDDAFDELYRRHVQSAWRLGQAVSGNPDDAADAVSEAFARVFQAVKSGRLQDGSAFRSYLLTATRNAAVDGLRRQAGTRPTDAEVIDLRESSDPSPAERVSGEADAALVAEAFRNLPERWRSVLWLTAVEGIAPSDAADQLGLTPNGTAQLAVRARAGLRERYLQAHVRNHARPECRFTVEHLGAYVGGGISPRDLAKVDQHLADCPDCRARKEELDDLGSTLRRIAVPVPLALGALSAGKVHAVLTASSVTSPAGLGARALHLAKEPTPLVRKAVASSTAGVLALGLLSLGLVSEGTDRIERLSAPKSQTAAAIVELSDPTVPPVDPLVQRFDDTVASTSGLVKGSTTAFGAPASVSAPSTTPSPAATPAPAGAPAPVAAQNPAAPATRDEGGLPSPEPVCDLPLVGLVCGGLGSDTDRAIPELPDLPALPGLPVPLPGVNIGVNLAGQEIGVAISLDDPGIGVTLPGVGTIGGTTPSVPEETGLNISIGSLEIGLP